MTFCAQHNISIITHRGLDFSMPDFFFESSYEAFSDQLQRGYGLEFDINFSRDDKIFIFHDQGLQRATNNKDSRLFQDILLREILDLRFNDHRLCSLEELLDMIGSKAESISALHLKSWFQEKKYLDNLLDQLKNHRMAASKTIIFDVKTETAAYLKKKMPEIILAPSIAHPYDIQRFNQFTGGTLYTIGQTLENKNFFDWAWLDEWDLTDQKGSSKKLYSQGVFDILQKAGIKIALVSPELHGTSPGLLGGESHPDAADPEALNKRIKEMIILGPDAICTDYPDNVLRLLAD
jgi:glycerophosphoryl diester phosphodiesterase